METYRESISESGGEIKITGSLSIISMPVTGFDTILTWANYRQLKTRPAGETLDAKTTTDYRTKNPVVQKAGNAVSIKSIDVEIQINSQDSWVLIEQMDDELLRHEQGHYDIAALAARDLHSKLLKLQLKDVHTLDTERKKTGDEIQHKLNVVDGRYDTATDHGDVKTEQDKWNRALAAEKQKADGSVDNLP
jgi:hypothetical protein